MKTAACLVLIVAGFLERGVGRLAAAGDPTGLGAANGVVFRFLDCETGRAVRPERIVTTAAGVPGEKGTVAVLVADASGRAVWDGAARQLDLAVTARGYRPLAVPVTLPSDTAGTVGSVGVLRFWLEPLTPPPERVVVRRPDTLCVRGFVVDDATGEPVSDVEVWAEPGSEHAITDGDGFFSVNVLATGVGVAEGRGSSLLVAREGYRAERHQNLELWPGGDWTYRIRLTAGDGVLEIDEGEFRRRAPTGLPGSTSSAGSAGSRGPASPEPESGLEPGGRAQAPEPLGVHPVVAVEGPPTSGAGAPVSSSGAVRLPRNIRVLRSDNVTVDYVTLDYYCRHVLPAEWIASWGNYSGGSNSLNAGAVAVRTYAIGYINNPRNSAYDICATTSCQVYGNATSSTTDTAVAFTADRVLVADGGAIPSGLSEYSAENNQQGAGCGDGFTAPTTGCLYDPVCAGESTFGHGRGLCQWGSARWATGRRMAGRTSSDGTATGYPRRDWVWILRHYYPDLGLATAVPLGVGDTIKALRNVNVRRCVDGGIAGGIGCTAVATKTTGATGTVVGGPETVTADGAGWTWYRVQWGDVIGWSVENYLDRVLVVPAAPTGLVADGVATNRIEIRWTDRASNEAGFALDRAPTATGPWLRLGVVGANVTSGIDSSLEPGSMWFYRVTAFNPAGDSVPVGPVAATTVGLAPALGSVGGGLVWATVPTLITNVATAPDRVRALAQFEPFASETANGVVLFRNPRYSTTTSGLLDTVPDLAAVTDSYPTAGHGTGCVLRVDASFSASTSAWLRLTSAGTAAFPNPVIPLGGRVRFDLFADRAVRVALGCRETVTAQGTPFGADGGTAGAIEWVGVSGSAGGRPIPTRTVAAGVWTTLVFDLAHEPVRSHVAGDGVLWTASGLGVLEHLALVPAAGSGRYTFYLDNFAVLETRRLKFSLGPDVPPAVKMDPDTGVVGWTPPDVALAVTNRVTVLVRDDSEPPMLDQRTFEWITVPRPMLAVAATGSEAGIRISWNAVAGARYRVQVAGEWPPMNGWVEASAEIVAQGPMAGWWAAADRERRYYRVVSSEW